MTTIYKVSDDSWVDGHDDCPCCSGITFECYNAVDWEQNGSATDIESLYKDILYFHTTGDTRGEDEYLLYEDFDVQELINMVRDLGIKVEWA